MQAYQHQQIASLNLPNNSTPGLLVTTSQHQQQLLQQQQQLQQQQSSHHHHTYQELVKAYLPQTMSTSHYNSIMTSFAVRLMSLNAHELRCLSSDTELMRIIDKAQSLIETRLQDINLNFALRQSQNDHHHHLIQLNSSPENYYQNFYVQQQQHQANQQLLLMASKYHEHTNSSPSNGLVGFNSMVNNQQHIAANNHQTPTSTTTSSSSSSSSLSASEAIALHGNANGHQQPISSSSSSSHQQNGLDLRTTSRPASAISDTPSPSRAGSTGSSGAQHPKKIKLTEYRRLQQLAEQATQQQHICTTQMPVMSQNSMTTTTTTTTSSVVKKYKGEFDEPTNEDVAERERSLCQPAPANYHVESALKSGTCACVLGSEFHDKTSTEALELLERWRSLDIDERVKWKWDVNDLPKDIPLSDIKKYEDLRRDYSRGRADFGGASKRKPLSIRGTRQFLLMLYCLHGHPGRDDIMQKEGYCPHCFAKIRTENEQSTLVRVVNHFNMKHRRGANPRLSPHLETAARAAASSAAAGLTPTASSTTTTTTTLASPTQIRETLDSMVESAVASVEETGPDRTIKIEPSAASDTPRPEEQSKQESDHEQESEER